MLDLRNMPHGLTRAPEPDSTPDGGSEEDAAATSARFKIEIDAFGRVVPTVVPIDSDDKAPAK